MGRPAPPARRRLQRRRTTAEALGSASLRAARKLRLQLCAGSALWCLRLVAEHLAQRERAAATMEPATRQPPSSPRRFTAVVERDTPPAARPVRLMADADRTTEVLRATNPRRRMPPRLVGRRRPMAGGARLRGASTAGYAVHVEYRPPVDEKVWLPVNRFPRLCARGRTRGDAASSSETARCPLRRSARGARRPCRRCGTGLAVATVYNLP